MTAVSAPKRTAVLLLIFIYILHFLCKNPVYYILSRHICKCFFLTEIYCIVPQKYNESVIMKAFIRQGSWLSRFSAAGCRSAGTECAGLRWRFSEEPCQAYLQ